MPERALVKYALAGFPHRTITHVSGLESLPMVPVQINVTSLTFFEKGSEVDESLCRTRVLCVPFEPLNPTAELLAQPHAALPQAVHAHAVFSLPEAGADAANCADMASAAFSLPDPLPQERIIDLLKKLRAASRQANPLSITINCKEETRDPTRPCDDPVTAFRALHWSRPIGISVSPPDATTTLTLWGNKGDPGMWIVKVDDKLGTAGMTHTYPPPF